MTSPTGNGLQYTLRPLPLSLEAEQLATQLEQTLRDPAATTDRYFQTLDRFVNVLNTLHQQRQEPRASATKH